MIDLKIKVDTKEFDKAFQEYMKYSKKDLSEIVNTKAYYIARNAVGTTKSADKETIKTQLLAGSTKYPLAPLGAILVNKIRKAKGQKGVNGQKMVSALEKFIRKAQASVNFLRSGWIPAIKTLERFVPKKSGPAYPRTKVKGLPKGGAKGAPINGGWFVKAEIWNAVSGGKGYPGINKKKEYSKLARILEQGLQLALNKEVASMRKYVEDKLAATAKRFNGH